MEHFDLGFDPDNVSACGFDLNASGRYDTTEKVDLFINRALERLRQLPEVRQAAFATSAPMLSYAREFFALPGQSTATMEHLDSADWSTVSPAYFAVLQIPIVAGRSFDAADRPGSPRVIIVNRSMAARYFPKGDAIGKKLMVLTMTNRPDVWREIVGVVGDVSANGPLGDRDPQVYEPIAQNPNPGMVPWTPVGVLLQTSGPAPTLSAEVRAVFQNLDPDLGVDGVFSLPANVARSWGSRRFSLELFEIFSGIAVLLAAIGIYGVIAYSVSQRTREFGIRMALGGQPRAIVALVLRGGARLLVIGLVLGTAGAWAGSQVLGSLLFNTSRFDPVTFGAIYAILGSVALLASWLPARRAASVDPAVALRR
jgi:putative ABC transport system permease protein